MSRRVDPVRRSLLLGLYYAGRTYNDIAAEYGGTAQGIRSTIRKMRARGDAIDRHHPAKRVT